MIYLRKRCTIRLILQIKLVETVKTRIDKNTKDPFNAKFAPKQDISKERRNRLFADSNHENQE
jgi:hypothetical protein